MRWSFVTLGVRVEANAWQFLRYLQPLVAVLFGVVVACVVDADDVCFALLDFCNHTLDEVVSLGSVVTLGVCALGVLECIEALACIAELSASTCEGTSPAPGLRVFERWDGEVEEANF